MESEKKAVNDDSPMRKRMATRVPSVRRLPRALRGNVFICVLLSLTPIAGALHVAILSHWLHLRVSAEELCYRSCMPLIGCVLLTPVVLLLLRMLRRMMKKLPHRRLVLLFCGGLLLCACLLALPGERGLWLGAGIILWGLLLRRLIRLSTGSRTGQSRWRDSRLSCILLAYLPAGVILQASEMQADLLAFVLHPFMLGVLYLLTYCAQGYRGGSNSVRRVLFVLAVSLLSTSAFMCMCSVSSFYEVYMLGLSPIAILLLYLLENRQMLSRTAR